MANVSSMWSKKLTKINVLKYVPALVTVVTEITKY